MQLDWRRYLKQISLQEERRLRVIEAVAAHFGRSSVQIAVKDLASSPVTEWKNQEHLPSFELNKESIRKLSAQQTLTEANTYQALCSSLSRYPIHVEEQILFGSRAFGQQIGRNEIMELGSYSKVNTALAVKMIFDCLYTGIETDRNLFLCLRSMGGSTVHIRKSEFDFLPLPSQKLMAQVRNETIKGFLEIVAPNLSLEVSLALELGDSFGLMQFHSNHTHALPVS